MERLRAATPPCSQRDTARVRKFTEEKVSDDDDIITTMVMVSADSGSETHAKLSNNFLNTKNFRK